MIRHCYHNNGFSNYLIKLKADSASEKMIQNLTFLVWNQGEELVCAMPYVLRL